MGAASRSNMGTVRIVRVTSRDGTIESERKRIADLPGDVSSALVLPQLYVASRVVLDS